MATKEVTSAPSQYQYYNYTYTHNPKGAYTSGESTEFDSMVGTGACLYDGMNFSGMKADIRGIKITCQCYAHLSYTSSNSHSQCSFRLVTGYPKGHNDNTNTSISSSAHKIFEKTKQSSQWEICEYVNNDINSDEIQWMRNNASKVLGGSEFGVRIFGKGVLFKNLQITIYYEENSTIYAGGEGGAYIGGLRRQHAG